MASEAPERFPFPWRQYLTLSRSPQVVAALDAGDSRRRRSVVSVENPDYSRRDGLYARRPGYCRMTPTRTACSVICAAVGFVRWRRGICVAMTRRLTCGCGQGGTGRAPRAVSGGIDVYDEASAVDR
jgi:hypothetical protein